MLQYQDKNLKATFSRERKLQFCSSLLRIFVLCASADGTKMKSDTFHGNRKQHRISFCCHQKRGFLDGPINFGTHYLVERGLNLTTHVVYGSIQCVSNLRAQLIQFTDRIGFSKSTNNIRQKFKNLFKNLKRFFRYFEDSKERASHTPPQKWISVFQFFCWETLM